MFLELFKSRIDNVKEISKINAEIEDTIKSIPKNLDSSTTKMFWKRIKMLRKQRDALII